MTLNLDTCLKIEGEAESKEDYYKALQVAINSGDAWAFPGHYGRSMMEAVESGRCMLGTMPARDYYQNRIPSRFEVQEGTKGSRRFVIDRCGEEWSDMLEGV